MNDYSYFSSVSDMLNKLEIEPLFIRRQINRLVNFHKAREGTLAVPVQKLLHPVRRHTRNSNQNNYIQIQAKKDCYLNSFIPRTTRDWNNLPEPITNIESNQEFKKALFKHYLK